MKLANAVYMQTYVELVFISNNYRHFTNTNIIEVINHYSYYKRRITMDRFDDNRATPKKRTGVKNDISSPDKEIDHDKNPTQTVAPEIMQPNPSSATPIIPIEMPARDVR